MTTLEDLRKANLKEQRGAGAPVAPKPEPVQAQPVLAEVVETPLIADLTEYGLKIEPERELKPAPEPASPEPVFVQETFIDAVVAIPAPPPPPDPLVERMRAAVLRKRPIASGVKATVDMSPELFFRAKRYCHDHSNSTLRQLMLEILSQFLDEEGY